MQATCPACDGTCCTSQEFHLKKRKPVKHDDTQISAKHRCSACERGTVEVLDMRQVPDQPASPRKDPWANAPDIFASVKRLYFDTFPKYRPSYADCQNMMAVVYSVSVRGDIGPGHRKLLEMLEKKLKQKGVLNADGTIRTAEAA